MIKNWDKNIFDFLREQKWMERVSSVDCYGNYLYEEKSEFVVNCSQLLGIGGEGIVIQKSIAERVGKIPKSSKDRKYEALKIIPITHNSEDVDNFDYIEDMFARVEAKYQAKRQAMNILVNSHYL